ncbi:hypothetical protein [Gephyromycinifex aptenodytis]|uniref:hypothetical protein n=1 Tax=Gephyromycinifex aptenodytis TaxID=2716227 RepID=UPI0014468BFF|nr:hypothetical protein [Gephyromycinifex aptenodytis]
MRHGGWRIGSATALVVLTAGSAGLTSAQAAAPTTLTGVPSSTVAPVGVRVLVRGQVSADEAREVHLQQLVGRTWKTVGSSTTTGRYSLRLPTAEPGVGIYRVHAPATTARAGATTKNFTVGVGRGDTHSYSFLTAPSVRWNPCTPIGYRVNVAHAPKGAEKDVHAAVNQVALATGLRFKYQGTTKVVPGARSTETPDDYPAGTQLVVAYAAPSESGYLRSSRDVLGVGGVFYQLSPEKVGRYTWRRALQGYVVLDPSHGLPTGFGAGRSEGKLGTWGQVLMHELGHVVGLDHPVKPDPQQIMNPATTEKPAQWGVGDLVGLRALGSSRGCFTKTPAAPTAGSAGAMVATSSAHQHLHLQAEPLGRKALNPGK